ncbi:MULTISPECIES: PLP-dependent aminotransferase family protein [Halocynthiibacter]|uniref:PLP-dependent aminotransferase family protein n=1 Tax=Halocynthiibacter halioticoli TaxID=2986804 RepID=A0AAE3J0E4_9RHOB|nr:MULTISPECIES: PLP-dependent aminotransferase family protein [Halocynthiibacter]MCV6824420.1 PLP-dependent aminotransferase family protein [Halocynthiibacter halioticoli]MCW4057421.1 PLP-dependent aminotransferase family protein [Halocynthiibacter sp. SDUM655004]
MNTIWFPDLSEAEGPKYRALAKAIREAVVDGRLPVGEKLPPVREVAWQLQITPGTVARAYSILVDDGVLEAAVGRGTFVAQRLMRSDLPEDSLINIVRNHNHIDFRGCRVPDVGQGKIINRHMIEAAKRAEDTYVDYPTSSSDAAARKAVCHWIGEDHVGRFEADNVVLGLGAQNCTILALQALLRGVRPVIMTEQLAYPGVRRAAQLLRAELVGLRMDGEGIRPDAFEEAIRQQGGQVLLTAAEVHSPTTIRTPYSRKRELAEIARRYAVQIIEDDCHRIAAPQAPAYRAILPEQSWYIGSLTKSVAASLRFGFLVAPSEYSRMARQVSQGNFYGLPQPILDLCETLIMSGEASDIRKRVVASCEDRVQNAVNILGQWDIRWRPDAPFLWLKMPQGWRGSRFALVCGEQGIRVKPADEFALSDAESPNAVRIAVNRPGNDARGKAALHRLNEILQQHALEPEI